MCQPEWRRARTAALAETGQDTTDQDTTRQDTTCQEAPCPAPATAPTGPDRTSQESRSSAHPSPLA
ncbi:hypothetical protein GCM10009601_49220 [Streptomyces thermospinosisporus]|uniref:Uncharacterized protein n=1 Tax=Streptomyces thermospinosisporus TaxID=161482 RepID=A0ABP4JUV6_9ACTN